MIRQLHGMWWGPERIWTSDLVRLNAERQHFPQTIESLLAAPLPEILTTGRHGIFLHVRSIHMHGSEPGGALMVSGSLYEAVSNQWNESPPTHNAESNDVSLEDLLLLPPPPPKSKWRALLGNHLTVTLPAGTIAGRYYPHALSHPCIAVNSAMLEIFLSLQPPTSRELMLARDLGVLCVAGLERGWFRRTTIIRFADRLETVCQSLSFAISVAQVCQGYKRMQ